jgi:hypothetical protein
MSFDPDLLRRMLVNFEGFSPFTGAHISGPIFTSKFLPDASSFRL